MTSHPPPGKLHLVTGTPNPHGAAEAALYLLLGDALSGPITCVEPVGGARLPEPVRPSDRATRLKLLHFNDLHGQICSIHGPGAEPLFARMAGWLRATRARYASDRRTAVLAVSAGDESGGGIFDVLLDGPGRPGVHAAYRLYSQAGVDAGVIGNHDLDRGSAALAGAIARDVSFPMLAANLSYARPEAGGPAVDRAAAGWPAAGGACYPAALYVVRGLRVGLIGLTTPAEVHPEPGGALRVGDPLAAARHLVAALRPLCDVLVVLSHLGRSLQAAGALTGGAGDVELALGLPRGAVQVIVGAHSHSALNEHGLSADNIVNGIPIVQAGGAGQFVGEVDVTAGEGPGEGGGELDIMSGPAAVTRVRLTAVATLPVDAAFERAQVAPLLRAARRRASRVIGRVVDDPELKSEHVWNAFAAGESALANFIADGLAERIRARGYAVDLAAVDASSVACGLAAGGELTLGDVYTLLPYADAVRLYRLSGRELLALLADNVLRVDRPGEPHTERGFLHFSAELRYTIRLGRSRAEARVEEAFLNGESLLPGELLGQPSDLSDLSDYADQTYLLATTGFVRGLAAGWQAQAGPELAASLFDLTRLPQETLPLYVRDLLLDYMSVYGGVLPEGGARRDGRLRLRM